MTITSEQEQNRQPVGNFYILKQDGLMGIKDGVGISPSDWRITLPSDREKAKSRWNDVKQLLEVESLNKKQISLLINNKEARDKATISSYERFGKMYEIEGGNEVVASKFREYAEQANSAISEVIKQEKMTNYQVYFEMSNEVQAENNLFDLAILTLDDRYDSRVRFEAKRKLELMDLAAKIDHRERQTKIKEHYGSFTDFLDEYVWFSTIKRGEAEYAYLHSTHDLDTNACMSVNPISRNEGEGITLQEGQKLTLLRRRKFRFNEREVSIYVTPREKSPESKILKLLRKGQENPALAVDDEIGLMGVLDSIEDAEAFKKHLRKSAINAGSMLAFEEIEDTLNGGEHKPNSIGSSTEVRMFKCFIRKDGARIEMIIHTNQTYLDYLYKDGVAHEEYEAKRLFDSGVMELLFPPSIYEYDVNKMKNSSLENVRKTIRSN